MTTHIDKVRKGLERYADGPNCAEAIMALSALSAHEEEVKEREAEVKELVEALEGLLKEAELIYEKRYYATPDRHKYNIHFIVARAALSKVKP